MIDMKRTRVQDGGVASRELASKALNFSDETTKNHKWKDKMTDIKAKDLSICEYSSKQQSPWVHRPPAGIKIIHIPTGIVVVSEDERSQHKNKAIAMDKLRNKLKNYREKTIAIEFFYWWHNQPGTNTGQGFDDWWAMNGDKFT